MADLHQLLTSSYARYVKQAKTKEEYTPQELERLIHTARNGSSMSDWIRAIGLGGLGGGALGGYVNSAFPALDAGINSAVVRTALSLGPKYLKDVSRDEVAPVVTKAVSEAIDSARPAVADTPIVSDIVAGIDSNAAGNCATDVVMNGIGKGSGTIVKELKKRIPICGQSTPEYVYNKAKGPFMRGALVGLLPGMGVGAVTNALLAQSRKYEAQDILDKIGVDWEKKSSMVLRMNKLQKIATLTKLAKLQKAAKVVYIIKQAEGDMPTAEELALLKQLAAGKNPGWLKSIGAGMGVGAGLGGSAGAVLGALANPESDRIIRRFGHKPSKAELALAGGVGNAINGGILGGSIGAISHALTRSGRQAVAIEKLKQLGIDL